MRGALAIRAPLQTASLDMAGANITTGAYVELIHALTAGVSAVEIFNPSPATMKIALGAAGSEVDLPYHIIPGGSAFLIPIPAGNKQRISLKAVDQTANSGLFTINCFG